MKKIKTFFVASLAVLALIATSCGSGEEKKAAPAPKTKTTKTEAHILPNYRYVDLDSVLSKYNLAKDFNEEMLRMQNNMASAEKHHTTKIQNFANTMQNKMQNNSYLSEASYRQDEQTLNNMQNEAQKALANLQNNMQNAALQGQQAVIDSITQFINEYNKTRGYDAIFQKASTLYINPELDITDEVVEGLNARYNKVAKK
ncbi:MAG: OmpH family outer membrane protein [Muribaculaceae bacterium]|nr:OmpH family outer membrane protein [Muribaculaceae bacterium]